MEDFEAGTSKNVMHVTPYVPCTLYSESPWEHDA